MSARDELYGETRKFAEESSKIIIDNVFGESPVWQSLRDWNAKRLEAVATGIVASTSCDPADAATAASVADIFTDGAVRDGGKSITFTAPLLMRLRVR